MESIIYTLIFLILWIYAIDLYYSEKKALMAWLQCLLMIPLIINLMAESFITSNYFGYLVVGGIMLFSFFTLIFAYYKD